MKVITKRPFVASTCLLVVGLLYLHTELSEPLLTLPQVLMGLLLLCAYPISWAIAGTKTALPFRIMEVALAAAFLSFALLVPIWRWQDRLTRQRGEVLIKRLDADRRQHGRYPDSLTQLVPRYLPKIPPTAQGLLFPPPFQYRPDTTLRRRAAAFWLTYYAGSMVDVTYASHDRQWHAED